MRPRSFVLALVVLLPGSAAAQRPATAPAAPAKAATARAAAARHPMSIDEFLALRTVGDPQLSPDGRTVAFTVTDAALEANKNLAKIWVVGADGGAARPLTSGPGSDRVPRWSPDGKWLAFLSTRDGGAQVWRMPAAGGAPVKVTAIPDGVGDFQWARDGKSLLLVVDMKWPAEQEIDRRNGKYPTDAKLWTGLFYRHWNEWRVGRRQHLFRQPIAGGKAVDLTPIDRDVPTLALGGVDIAQSPKGDRIAVVYNPDSVVATSTNNDIFVMNADGSGRTAITTNPANDNTPLWSPDGTRIAYLAMAVPGFEADRQAIWLYDPASGERRALTGDWDRSVAAISWMPDGRALLAQVEEHGEDALYSVDATSGARTKLVGGGLNAAAQVSPDGKFLVFLRQTATTPPEVWRADIGAAGGGAPRPLTRVNAAALAKLELTPAEPFTFLGAKGDSVSGWLMRPPGFVEGQRYPLVYLIHGGPQGAWLDQWHARWNYAMFAARGYVVAAVNFHGSTGYGQAFTNSISGDWGGAPYEDLMTGLDYLLATRPYIDRDRLGAAGASYGGYMIYWMAGHTDRFKTLVAHDGVFNPRSMAGSTEELWFPIHEFGGSQLTPAGRATMEKWSPAAFVDRWSTPMLVVHSQHDYRVDLSEGLQAFTALQLRHVPSKFLYFPDEDHWVARPRNRRLWWDTVLDWLDQSLRTPAAVGQR